MEWVYFPKTTKISGFLQETVKVFKKYSHEIDSTKNDNNDDRLSSDEVLKIIEPGLCELGYEVEKSKKAIDKLPIPVLFGSNGKTELNFEADAFCSENNVVVEVESGRALTNYQFLKDIFEASMMVETQYLVLAVRIQYKQNKDYEKIKQFIDTIYLTNRIKLDLLGILLIGY